MRYFAEKAKQATFVCADFRDLLERVEPGDMVYCDPPYVPLSRTSNFTEYAPTRFSWRDHTQLAGYARALAERGVTVVISNHRTPSIESLYRGAEIHCMEARRAIGHHCSQQTIVEELITVFPPP